MKLTTNTTQQFDQIKASIVDIITHSIDQTEIFLSPEFGTCILQ